MQHRLSDCNFDYLRPPKEVLDVTHSDFYIRHGEGKKSVRKIFNVTHDRDEIEKIKELEAMIAQERIVLPPNWNQVKTLYFIYSGKFDTKKAFKNLKQHLEWLSGPRRGVCGPKAFELLQSGKIYISGRDNQLRPIIVINIYQINPKEVDMNDLVEAVCFVLDVAKKFYFFPGKVENWVIILETNGAGILNFPIKTIKAINETTSVNYTSLLDKTYIMNPGYMLKKSWGVIQSIIDPETAGKISMLGKSDYKQLLEKIPIDQLEERYGGTLPTPASYWPPTNTLNRPPHMVHSQELYVSDYKYIPIESLNRLRNTEEDKAQSQILTEIAERAQAVQPIDKPQSGLLRDDRSPIKSAKSGFKSLFNNDNQTNSPFKGNQNRDNTPLNTANNHYTFNEYAEVKQQAKPGVNVRGAIQDDGHGTNSNTSRAARLQTEERLDSGTNDNKDNMFQGYGYNVEASNNGLVLENQTVKTGMCGFCRPKDTQNGQSSSDCNMF